MIKMATYFERASERFDASDYSTAFQLYQQAVVAGETVSGCIGLCYHEGLGTRRNRRLAMQWYQLAVHQGDVAAASNLGDLFAESGDVRRANAAYGRAWRMGLDDALVNAAKLALKLKRSRRARLLVHRLRLAIAANRTIDHDEAVALADRLALMSSKR